MFPNERRNRMTIQVARYAASASPVVQAFVDIEVDHWLRFAGLHYRRDGTLRSAQLTPLGRDGRRQFFNAVEIIDADLRELLTQEILAAIRAHIETLPLEQRVKPPEQRIKPLKKPGPVLERTNKLEPIRTPKPVPPPQRLLVGKRVAR
jgi:hypothetical protein